MGFMDKIKDTVGKNADKADDVIDKAADFVDDKTGIAFYSAAVSLPPDVLHKVSDNMLRSGSPVQVVMPVRARTALSYVFEPLLNASWLAFREK